MSASTKLSTSVKALCYLAATHPIPKKSTEIAKEIGTNASKLRRLLSLMNKTGIVESTQGTTGGFVLKKLPKKIHLQEVYCSIEDRKAFHLDVTKNGREDKLNKKFNDYFLGLFADIQVEIEESMTEITIESIMKKLGIKSKIK